MAVAALEDHALSRESIDIGSLDDLVAVSTESGRLEVVGNKEKDVFDFRFRTGADGEKGQKQGERSEQTAANIHSGLSTDRRGADLGVTADC